MTVATFIANQGAQHGVPHATGCRALGVSQAWFYKWCHGDRSPRRARRAQLTVKIRQLFAWHRGRYGSPRITADLQDLGWRVSQNTVAAIMREQGLVGRSTRRLRIGLLERKPPGQWRHTAHPQPPDALDGPQETHRLAYNRTPDSFSGRWTSDGGC